MRALHLTPEQFRAVSDRIADVAQRYLAELDARAIKPHTSAAETQRAFGEPCPEQGLGERALDALADVVKHSRAQNGRFFGYVLGSGEPVGAAADLLASVLNAAVTSWRSGPAAATMEKTVVGWLAQALGCSGF